MILGLIILSILSVTSLSETFPSPLFGSAVLGGSFDDSVSTVVSSLSDGLHTLHISYGAFVFGLQASYHLQNGGIFIGKVHGKMSPIENSTILKFQEKERIIRIIGSVEQTYGYITRLKLYTKSASGLINTYGPFGGGGSCDTTFTFAGAVVFLFGRSGEYLNALGVYILNSLLLPLYNRTQMIGGIYGTAFDDYPILTLGPPHILNMTINSDAYINGLKITYRLPNGTYFVSQPGQIGSNDKIIRFHDGEMIVQVDLAVFSLWVNYLMFSTLDPSGTRRIYGPYGDIPQSNITTIHGTVNGFFGRVGMDHNITAITGLGFYV